MTDVQLRATFYAGEKSMEIQHPPALSPPNTKTYIKLEKRAMHILESLWTFPFTNRGLQPKWFLATAESNKRLHG
jgi:hypothetical protein